MKWFKNDPKEFARGPLEKETLRQDPLEMFKEWFECANQTNPETANIMTLATVTAEHRPNCRIVLLKGIENGGFVFFTNYHSRKANELDMQDHACINFFWFEQKRQVRIQGKVEQVSQEASDTYFATRPRESQIGAWASDQSSAIPSRAYLEQRYEAIDKQYKDQTIPRPPHWGGFILYPRSYEFWQGADRRLHDRFHYSKNDIGKWAIERLAP